MTISAQQATDSLRDVARTQHRASVLRGYENGAPHFLLWGVIWLVGYACTELFPGWEVVVWLVLDVVGITGSFRIARATPSVATTRAKSGRFVAAGFTIAAFMAATYFVMVPHTNAQFGAFPPLVMALMYTLVGIYQGIRWAVVGIALFVLTVLGYALLREHFMLWMAVFGGGTLLLTGFWMRRA